MSSDAEDINAYELLCMRLCADRFKGVADINVESLRSWRDLRATLENHIGYPSKAQTSRVLNRQLLKVRVCCPKIRMMSYRPASKFVISIYTFSVRGLAQKYEPLSPKPA